MNWILEILGFNKSDNVLVGLSQLRETKEPVLQEVRKPSNNRDVKLSDLIKGGDC
jgi:hypothetical protein